MNVWDIDGDTGNVLYAAAFLFCVAAFLLELRNHGRAAFKGWAIFIIAAIAFDQYIWWRT